MKRNLIGTNQPSIGQTIRVRLAGRWYKGVYTSRNRFECNGVNVMILNNIEWKAV